MTLAPQYSAVIFDLGDVLFGWSSDTKTSISSQTLRSILSSPIWFEYERGVHSEDICYELIGKDFHVDPEEVRRALQQARDSLVANHDLIHLISDLKEQSKGRLRVYAMSNISIPDWEVLREKPADWNIFDRVFTSGGAGERKPNLGFYKHVIAETGVDPYSTIFVDDKLDNIISARSIGLHGIVFESTFTVKRALRNLIGNPSSRGHSFLNCNSGKLVSMTEATSKQDSVALHENFAQLLILEATNDRKLVNLVEHSRTWNFFQGGKGTLTTEKFPFDLDTTSLGLTVLKRDKEVANSVMDEMLQYMDNDGILQTYFDHRRPRFDPVVCVNVLALFYTYGRGRELQRTQNWVYEVLLNRAYLDGTRYYDTPECFLYFLSRLLANVGDSELHALFKHLLRERIQERIGAGGDSLALAMRILVCEFVGIRDEVDLRALLPLQCEDGGWEIGWIYKYGSSGIRIGNRGLSTALAIKAIDTIGQRSMNMTPTPANTLNTQLPSPTKDAQTPHPSPKRRQRGVSFRASLQWLWTGSKARNSIAI
ncbi:HAD-like domain-containing protein [Cyathus striatus]|nr:HAD-like domain-containing protein [Cyathus striatus]